MLAKDIANVTQNLLKVIIWTLFENLLLFPLLDPVFHQSLLLRRPFFPSLRSSKSDVIMRPIPNLHCTQENMSVFFHTVVILPHPVTSRWHREWLHQRIPFHHFVSQSQGLSNSLPAHQSTAELWHLSSLRREEGSTHRTTLADAFFFFFFFSSWPAVHFINVR